MPGRLSLLVALTVAVLAAPPAGAGIEPFVFATDDVAAYSCLELLALEPERQSLALVYFGGYVDGQRGASRFDTKAKGEVIDRVMEHCRTDAAGSVLEAFRRLTP